MGNKLTFPQLFLLSASKLASYPKEFGAEQAGAGFNAADWNLLTDKEPWSTEDARKIDSILAGAVSICLITAGLPPTPLPSAYVAAVICKLVSEPNRLVAATRAPQSFDAMSALGFTREYEDVKAPTQQIMAQVLYFSTDEFQALMNIPIDEVVEQQVRDSQD